MKYKCFLLDIFQVLFHIKRLIILSLICLLLGTSNVFAAGGIQQTAAGDARQLLKQAKKLTDKGEFAEAEKVLRRVIEINPLDAKAKLNLAYVLVKQRQLLEAYNFSIEIAKAESANSYAFAVLGTTLLSFGNFRDARISLINALRINKKESLAWASL